MKKKIEPNNFILLQNYPNPFNPSTNIEFELLKSSTVTLSIYDMLGREVTRLIDNEEKSSGKFKLSFDASKLSSGIYIYQIRTDKYRESKKMILLK